MKTQKFGIEVEMTGITRRRAAEVAAAFFGTTSYDETARDQQGRTWKFVYDGSIQSKKKVRGSIEQAGSEYSVEMVSPILTYEDIPTLQELVRQLRHAGALSDSAYKCGIHIHVNAEPHTPQSLRNIVNLMASKEDLIYKSLQVDPSRLSYCKRVNEQMLEV